MRTAFVRRLGYLFNLPLIILFIAGCASYHIAGKSGHMPGDIANLAIPVFANNTPKPDIEAAMTGAFSTEFATTVELSENSRYMLQGAIKMYELKSVSYSKSDINQEYRLTVVISLKIVNREDREVLWSDDNISRYADFAVNVSDVTATRTAETDAFRKITKDIARLVKERMLENF